MEKPKTPNLADAPSTLGESARAEKLRLRCGDVR
jgi:hypothetical protein